jgi:DNA-directed RNA polymerase sigma subunit (sigma70/sigma32)
MSEQLTREELEEQSTEELARALDDQRERVQRVARRLDRDLLTDGEVSGDDVDALGEAVESLDAAVYALAQRAE